MSALSLASCLAGGALECRYPPTSLVEAHGGQLYERMCAVCHGPSGEGYKADNAPAIAHPDFLASATDAYLREAVAHGRAGSTMSAWGVDRGGPLASADVDAVVAFMRSWDRGETVKLDPTEPKGNAARGEGTYARSCASCHGARGVSGSAVHIGDPGLLASASDGFLRYAIQKGRAGTAMPPFGSTLGKNAIEDVLTLLRSWQERAPRAARPPAARPPPLPLGPVPLHPTGPDPVGFRVTPLTTPADVIKAQLDRGSKMGLLDARAPSDYAREHIAGAVSVPFYDPEPYLSALPKDAWLVCYCACPHAESGTLAGQLAGHGFTKVTVLDEGLGVWKSRGYGTHVGLEP